MWLYTEFLTFRKCVSAECLLLDSPGSRYAAEGSAGTAAPAPSAHKKDDCKNKIMSPSVAQVLFKLIFHYGILYNFELEIKTKAFQECATKFDIARHSVCEMLPKLQSDDKWASTLFVNCLSASFYSSSPQSDSLNIWLKYSCLPYKVNGLVAGGEDGLADYQQRGIPSFAFVHHQDDVEEPVENPLQGLDSTHQWWMKKPSSVVALTTWLVYFMFTF